MNSPYWKIFYGPPDTSEQTEDVIPETPPAQLPTVPLLLPPSPILAANQTRDVECYRASSLAPSPLLQPHSVMHSTSLVSVDKKLKGVQYAPMDIKASKKLTNPRSKPILGSAKKHRKYNPYGSKSILIAEPTDLHLMETPVFQANEAEVRALVAGPKQPPVDK